MTDEAVQTNSAPAAAETEAKPKRKPAKKPKKRLKAKAKPKAKRKKAANFTFKGPGGAKERKARGEHLLIVRSRISTVKKIDRILARKGCKFRSRNAWLANVIDVASKR